MKTPSTARRLHERQTDRSDFARDVRAGLSMWPKRIPSKYFYDARGSALFEAICAQPEYYLTRTELAILRDNASDIAAAIGPRPQLVEYGSGSAIKTRLLLEAMIDPVAYLPVEISESALAQSIERLAPLFPHVEMLPVCADFTGPVRLPAPRRAASRTVVFFPGSTLGNFEWSDAIALLRRMHSDMGSQGLALVGIDLKKDRAVLEAAYDDRAGVTAAFTLNLLERMNRELDADFDVSRFRHRSIYNALAGRIETHLVSAAPQRVHVDGREFAFAADEAMLVEYSCKYSQPDFERMAAKAGLQVVRSWSDPGGLFAVQLLRRVRVE